MSWALKSLQKKEELSGGSVRANLLTGLDHDGPTRQELHRIIMFPSSSVARMRRQWTLLVQ